MSARNFTPSFSLSTGTFSVPELQALYSRLQRASPTIGKILDRIPSQTVSGFPTNLRNRPIPALQSRMTGRCLASVPSPRFQRRLASSMDVSWSF